MMVYVFYDTETSGLSPEFDQILQFAAIRTDNDFNEIDRFEIRSQLLPYIVPAPGALRVTGIGPELLMDSSIPSHYQATRQIREKLLDWSPAIFIGYNTISFDENLLRQALFQTLHSPYVTNTQSSARADVIRLVHAVVAYVPDCLTVPTNEKGKAVFKLDQLAPANGFEHENAHEAMADVEATIHIAKVIRNGAPKVWQNVMRSCRKSAAVDTIMSTGILALTEFYFNKEYSWLVTYCGQNSEYSAQMGVFDLQHDPTGYVDLDVDALVDILNDKHKVIRSIRTNAQPILMPYELATSRAAAKTFDLNVLRDRVNIIRDAPEFQKRLGLALAKRYPSEEPSPYSEKRIYDGFPSRGDEALMQRFHGQPWADRFATAEQLDDDSRRELAYRVIYCEAAETLPNEKRTELENWVRRRILSNDESVPWNTIHKAIRETDDLLALALSSEKEFLENLRTFYEGYIDRTFGTDSTRV
jgi:exodeoxyribonuclease I